MPPPRKDSFLSNRGTPHYFENMVYRPASDSRRETCEEQSCMCNQVSAPCLRIAGYLFVLASPGSLRSFHPNFDCWIVQICLIA